MNINIQITILLNVRQSFFFVHNRNGLVIVQMKSLLTEVVRVTHVMTYKVDNNESDLFRNQRVPQNHCRQIKTNQRVQSLCDKLQLIVDTNEATLPTKENKTHTETNEHLTIDIRRQPPTSPVATKTRVAVCLPTQLLRLYTELQPCDYCRFTTFRQTQERQSFMCSHDIRHYTSQSKMKLRLHLLTRVQHRVQHL